MVLDDGLDVDVYVFCFVFFEVDLLSACGVMVYVLCCGDVVLIWGDDELFALVVDGVGVDWV